MRLNTQRVLYAAFFIAALSSSAVRAASPLDIFNKVDTSAERQIKLDCPSSEQVFSSPQGEFRLVICTPAAVPEPDKDPSEWIAPMAGGELRFIHTRSGQETTTTWPIETDMLSAWVGGEGAQFWGEHIMTLDIGTERNGYLFIANWNGQAFVVSEYYYRTGDEDAMTLNWQDGDFLIDTPPDGQRRLIAQGVESAAPGTFTQEILSCTSGTGTTEDISHTLSLAIDTAGRVTTLSYLSSFTRPDGGETPFTCTVNATRDDYETEWIDSPSGDTVVGIDGEGMMPVGEPYPPEVDHVQIKRNKNNYALRFDVDVALFCDLGSMAKSLTLERGNPSCLNIAPQP